MQKGQIQSSNAESVSSIDNLKFFLHLILSVAKSYTDMFGAANHLSQMDLRENELPSGNLT